MAKVFSEIDWTVLLENIADGNCTPFLGAGACYGVLPLGGEVSRQLAKDYNYPFEDISDLPRVSQYLATNFDPRHAKRAVLKMIAAAPLPWGAPGF